MNATRPTAVSPDALSSPSDTSLSTRLLGAATAFALGAFFVWGAGFAGAETLHDTAHDARHAMGLPCH
ncbi:CbtB domain-containing protein [Aureimonas pseudogalii]|uniref:Cobalt transporter subunit CbtB n=1 Tax=Aureimonas pseudogalii TaxID=1744844 RepID=A0A7W6H749_9HYPH|nr:CbtB domain-containing protein [Aureimonas pseudogalii]MBB3999668.1 cobalt transporter subunit CbtB [Aureimonas pseudogalii]